MKRSRINEIMTSAGEMTRAHGFALPPFAFWSPEEFAARAGDVRIVIDARCGWGITDYGADDKLRLAPGESVMLRPRDRHAFWGEGGEVLIGGVSTVNDDETDTMLRDPIGRFAEIEQDAAPAHLLVSDYRARLG